ncbi:efflux RND transporter permease subunit [Vibrio lentus]|nr:efflux RND transporter permease subunit [Vibrio lentus]
MIRYLWLVLCDHAMTGFTINTVTLFGLILAIGIVLDDAILVIENVDTTMCVKGQRSHRVKQH